MSYTLVIKNGLIVDGTGRPSFKGDVGISGDTITAVGRIADCGDAAVIDAAGKVVSPGFIEAHTHYDPQLCWDRTASPAAEHGVTTIIVGNCGLSLAPVQPGFGQRVTKMFSKIEDISPTFFDAAVPYSWQSFSDYLDFLRPGLGVNVGATIGHSLLRHFVMGAAAQERAATDAELEAMCRVLRESIAAGAFGLSISYEHDTDEHDVPMASAFADVREKIALAQTVVESGRLYVQASLTSEIDRKLEEYDELAIIARESGACCSTIALLDIPSNPPVYQAELDKLVEIHATGGKVYAQTMVRPLDYTFQLTKAANIFYLAPVWSGIMIKPLEERKQLLSDPAIWPDLHQGLDTYTAGRGIGHFSIKRTYNADNTRYQGRKLREIAESEGVTPTEIMLRVAVLDDFKTVFESAGIIHCNSEVVAKLLDHPLVQVGSSDAGAHVAQFAGAGDPTYMLEHFVRERGDFTLERAIQRMTSDLARDFGISRRGTIQPGNFADVVVFDPATVKRGPEIVVQDLPGGGERIVRHTEGFDKVIVNGQVFVDRGVYTDARAGRTI